ncbi:hypothetical protein [Streptomyces soliscabiei]|uniref:hypothetical protein n=1 Tax=Streptomyces soliscabiei TaxID=588897 RepID=UPI0029A3196B|nr:hypothetical protein [Streptomyces sp. NY05-11A]MDX2679643.1 hypothetical protein [Streptomyces sp. NY05-11A]
MTTRVSPVTSWTPLALAFLPITVAPKSWVNSFRVPTGTNCLPIQSSILLRLACTAVSMLAWAVSAFRVEARHID